MTDDFLGVVEAKRFLGREFLTWLVHRIEEGEARLEHDPQPLELQLGDRVVLERAAFENDLFLRLADVEEAAAVLGRLFAEFCELRGASAWGGRVLSGMR